MFKTIWGYIVWAVLAAVLYFVVSKIWNWFEKKREGRDDK